jgi:hypothetical protein
VEGGYKPTTVPITFGRGGICYNPTARVIKPFVTNLHYVFIYYILDNLIWLYFPLTPIEKSNRPIVYHVVRLPMRFKQGELKVSRHMYVEWSTRFVFK